MKDILLITKKQEANKSRTNKFYFLTIFSVVFGNSVGIAIFTENREALLACRNPLVLIIAYAFIGITCLSLLLVCIELMSSTENKFNTIPHWLRNFYGRRMGSISAIFYSFIYMPAIISTLALMSWGLFFNVIDAIMLRDNWMPDDWKAALIFILAAISIITLIIFNAYSSKYKEFVIIILNSFKIIPIVSIFVVCGIAFFTSNTYDGTYHNEEYNNNNVFTMIFSTSGIGTDIWSLKYMVLALPIVMLSYDGFLHGVSVSNDKEYSKIVTKSSILAVILMIIINICVASMLLGVTTDANLITLYGRVFPQWATYTIGMLISFCVLGSIIGFGSFGSNNYYTATDPNVEGGQILATKSGWQYSYEKAAWRQLFFYMIFLVFIFFCSYPFFKKFISYDQNVVTKSFLTGDAVSQIPLQFSIVVATFSFLFYTNLIFALVINRFTKKRDVNKIIGIGIFGIILVPVLWSACFYLLYDNFSNIRFIIQISTSIDDMSSLSKGIVAAFTFLQITIWLTGFFYNEWRLRKNMFRKIFANT
ncbi:amino acid permease [Spiroplasma endosymbiont of Aspidapion aeneum]|uniref:amino acid permease n=1 Tax=Spiroplasma endosymbiont of Aspidapion aeneum TaxID=3066276 RepID=UPI00313C9611